MLSKDSFIHQTGPEWRCVDGRPGLLILKQQSDESWQVAFRGQSAGERQGPQVLGASLGFVAVAEKFANLSTEKAFEVVETAHQQLGFEPQFHIDDHHFPVDTNLLTMSDEEVILLVLNVLTGCGFAKYHYGEQADNYIRQAQGRGWSIQVLTGNHNEAGATKNYVTGTTFDTFGANQIGENIIFNQDSAEVSRMLTKMGEILDLPDFASTASAWLDQTYDDVVKTLTNGQVQAADIQEIR